MTAFEPICEKCEEVLQPYLDRELSEAERRRGARRTSTAAATARKRYRFEESLRQFVRQACDRGRCRRS